MSYTRNNRCYYSTRFEKVKGFEEKSRKFSRPVHRQGGRVAGSQR